MDGITFFNSSNNNIPHGHNDIFTNNNLRPVRSTWAPPRPPTPRWPLQERNHTAARDEGYEYIRPIMEGYEGGDDETQIEEMSVVSSITDCFMQADDEEFQVEWHPP